MEAFKFSISYSVESCVRLISTFQTSENSGQTHIFFTNAGKARLILGNTTKQQLQFPCLAAASTTFFPLMVSIDCPMGGLLFFHRLKEKVEAARRPDTAIRNCPPTLSVNKTISPSETCLFHI